MNHKSDVLEYRWRRTGRLIIKLETPRAAVLTYRPARMAMLRYTAEAATKLAKRLLRKSYTNTTAAEKCGTGRARS